jgi:hypothetical protein
MGVANLAATLVGLVAVGVVPPATARQVDVGAPQPATARLSVKPDKGFVDDAFALDPSGSRVVLIRTDREEFQRVEIHDLDAAKPEPATAGAAKASVRGFDLVPPSRGVESIAFLPDGASLLLVGPGPDGGRVAEAMDLSGKVLGKMNVPAEFAVGGTGSDAKLVTLERRPGRGGEVNYVVSPFKLPSLKAAGKARTYALGGDGLLRPSGLGPVGFFDGYSKMLARRPGAYDKKKDVRQPDGQAVLDLLSGKTISTGPIDDVYSWARLMRLRPEHPNRTAFVQLAGANAGPTDQVALSAGAGAGTGTGAGKAATGVELVDPSGRLTRLELAIPFRLYDRLTLKDQEGPAPGMLTFALEVDPVNPDAVARKKADARVLDVYGVGGENPRAARLRARVALSAQPIVWSVAGNRLVVLHRFKSFARGGDRLDVYDLEN